MITSTELTTIVTYFTVGSKVEYGNIRGVVVGIDFRALSQKVRIMEVIRQAPNRCIGDVILVPFNHGKEIA